jgi:protein phosphatase 2C family protein 2/3
LLLKKKKKKDMEDAHSTILEYGDTGASFFAVFDGHGGMDTFKN